MRYSIDVDQDKTAKAYGYELRCSRKDAQNLARQIRGMKVEEAKKYLQNVIEMKLSVPAVYHNRKVSHQKGIGPGSFPVKAAKEMLKTLENAENNAEYKGFDVKNMRIKHVSAYGGRVIKGIMPRAHGRATAKDDITSNIEIVIEEVE